MQVKDSDGKTLNAGDSVVLIQTFREKDLLSYFKSGTIVKNIQLTYDNKIVKGKVDGNIVVVKTCFVKKK